MEQNLRVTRDKAVIIAIYISRSLDRRYRINTLLLSLPSTAWRGISCRVMDSSTTMAEFKITSFTH